MKKAKLSNCKCGYVPGCTTGYPLLTIEERGLLLSNGYKLSTNVLGDEIARNPNGKFCWFKCARFALHEVMCIKAEATKVTGGD